MTERTTYALDYAASAIRKLVVADRQALVAHFLRLDAESLRMRFGATLSDEALRAHADRCLADGFINYGFFVQGTLRAVAELHVQPDHARLKPTDRMAEAAFSVEAGWREHGVATELFRRILRAARNRGVTALVISCLSWNKPMQTLARKFQAEFRWEEGEIVGTVIAKPASPASIVDEFLQDAYGALVALRQRRWAGFASSP